jgi:hypothetical protein
MLGCECAREIHRRQSRVDAVQAALFRRLREHYQKRDRLRLILDQMEKLADEIKELSGEAASRIV